MDVRDPVAQPFVHRILERAAPAGDGHDFRAEQLHAEDIGRLAPHILCAHIDYARQAEARADRGSGHAMLTRAGFRDDARLAHADGEQDLPDAIVDLVRARVIELVTFEPDLRAAQRIGQPLCKIERGGAAHVMLEQIVELALEFGIGLSGAILPLKIEDERHERFGDIAPAVIAEMSALVGLVAIGIGIAGHAALLPRCCGQVERGFGLSSTSRILPAIRRCHE